MMLVERSTTKMFRALGTANSIFIPHSPDKMAADTVEKRIYEIDSRMSVFRTDSDIYNINKSAGARYVTVHADTMHVIKRAVFFSMISKGTFDITALPLVDTWGFGKKLNYVPDNKKIIEAKSLISYQDILIDDRNLRVMLRRTGQKICLGGIAKGYAADEARRILSENNINNAMINLGGNIITMGEKDGRPWTVGIQNPVGKTGSYIGSIIMRDETAVTSGSNEQYFIEDGKRYHHILDPHTGKPADTDLLSVTVIGKCSMDMDALSTTAFILGMEKSISLLHRFNAQAIYIFSNGNVYLTEGLYNRFHSFRKNKGAL